MATPQEAFGIPDTTAERIAGLHASDVATYVGAWIERELGGNLIEALAQPPQSDSDGFIERFGGDMRAIVLEFTRRTVANMLGSSARIVIEEEDGI